MTNIYRERYDMSACRPRVIHIAPDGTVTTLGYLVWPNPYLAHNFNENRLAALELTFMGTGGLLHDYPPNHGRE